MPFRIYSSAAVSKHSKSWCLRSSQRCSSSIVKTGNRSRVPGSGSHFRLPACADSGRWHVMARMLSFYHSHGTAILKFRLLALTGVRVTCCRCLGCESVGRSASALSFPPFRSFSHFLLNTNK